MEKSPSSVIDTSYLTQKDRDTLGEDMRYHDEVLTHRPTIFFRPGDRTSPTHPNHLRHTQGDFYLGFISIYGSHEEKRPPIFLEPRIPIRILSQETMVLRDVSQGACADAYSEITTPATLLSWLTVKYPHLTLDLNSPITQYRIAYGKH